MTGEPVRNSYLRSEIANFLRTLSTLAANAADDNYRRGWQEALTAMAMLAGIQHDAPAQRSERPSHDHYFQ